jgi:hypothetical protein
VVEQLAEAGQRVLQSQPWSQYRVELGFQPFFWLFVLLDGKSIYCQVKNERNQQE